MPIYGFQNKQYAEALRDYARDKLAPSYSLRIKYPKPKLLSRTNVLWIGKLKSNLVDCDMGTLALWDQMDEDCPSEITPEETLDVLNITGFELKTGHFMYAQRIKYFEQLIVFPAQLQECPP